MKTLYLDCFSGISGDMSVGALVDAGADLDSIAAALASLGIAGFHVTAEKVVKKGISATQFLVHCDPDIKQPHRHLRHMVEIIERGALPEEVKSAAVATFHLLAEAEAEVHNTTVEKVHFHEVGAVDSIVDVVAAQYAKHLLGIERVVCSPLNVGGGTVKCSHGVMPVPPPAAALLLRGKPTYGTADVGELTTPTGAALVSQWTDTFGPAPKMRTESIGYGSGEKELADRANVLRVLVGESEEGVTGGEGSVLVVEANIDDMTGELFPPLIAAILEAGAVDAFLTPVLGKKGRPAHLVTALCAEAQLPEVTEALITHSTTLGVRWHRTERHVLERCFGVADTDWGPVRVKLGIHGDIQNSAAPEFEDCRALAEAHAVPVRHVYEAALAAAYAGELRYE